MKKIIAMLVIAMLATAATATDDIYTSVCILIKTSEVDAPTKNALATWLCEQYGWPPSIEAKTVAIKPVIESSQVYVSSADTNVTWRYTQDSIKNMQKAMYPITLARVTTLREALQAVAPSSEVEITRWPAAWLRHWGVEAKAEETP